MYFGRRESDGFLKERHSADRPERAGYGQKQYMKGGGHMMNRLYQAGLLTMAAAIFMGTGAVAGAEEDKAFPQLVISNASDWYSTGEPEYKTLYKGYYEMAYLDSESAELYPELDKTILDWSWGRQEAFKANNSDMHDLAQEYYDQGAQMFPLESQSNIYVRRSDDQALSILTYTYDYAGGAHGYYFYRGLNIDAQTGEELTLDRIFTDPEELPGLLNGILAETYPDIHLLDVQDLAEDETDTDARLTDWNWTLDPNGVTFYFNPYELACYADGALQAFVPFDGNDDLFTGEFGEQEGSWAMGLPNYFEQNFQKSDGSWHKVNVSFYPDEYDSYQDLNIAIDGNSKTFDNLWYYSGNIYLVRLKNGANYIYASLRSDNDYNFLCVYDLYRNPYEIGEISGSFMTDYERSAEVKMNEGSCICAFSHPDHFRMSTIIQYMSTVVGERDYEPGESGMPLPLTSWYEISPRTLTLKRDITLQAVNYPEDDPCAEGKAGGEIALKAGEKLTFWRSDGEHYMDLLRGDGSAVRCVLDESQGWPYYVDGGELENVFDGIIFAG